MSGTFTAVWVYVLAELVGGIAAAILYATVVGPAAAPIMEQGDPQAGVPAGDRGLATGSDESP